MNKSVLIVDDDQEFGSLLRGVFEQAGYTVHLSVTAEVALQVLQEEVVDLVITDQRLADGMSGGELIREIRRADLQIPVIMVSGFLNDDAIRDIIRNGVEGIYIKPLNIFSLLKKASELIQKHALKSAARQESASSEGGGALPSPEGSICGVQGFSNTGLAFLERAREAASFKRILLLIGPSGSLFEDTGRDLVRMNEGEDRCISCLPGQVNPGHLDKIFTDAGPGKPVTLLIPDAEKLSADEVALLMETMDEKGGGESGFRIIFCLSKSVEVLYDAGKIDEEFYLFLGSNELRIPALKDMPEDLIAITRRELRAASGKDHFNVKLRTLLLDYDWPDNFVELHSTIVRAINMAQPLPPEAKHFEAILKPLNGDGDGQIDGRSTLERFLEHEKNRYNAAIQILSQS